MFVCQKKIISCEYSNWEGPKAPCNEYHRPLFTLMPTLPEPFLSPKCFQPSGYSVQSACILMIQTCVLWCRMPVAPSVGSSFHLSCNRHGFYMLCDPVLMFYEQQPAFHVHVSTWVYSIHRDYLLQSRLEALAWVSCCGLSASWFLNVHPCFSSCHRLGVCFA